jgi:hypothetical protein
MDAVKILAGLVAFTAGIASPALAQTYTMTWNTIDGGGAQNLTGGGGRFSLSGTAGQPDATTTTLTGGAGAYAFDGGFWPGAIVVPCPCVADFDASGGTPDASDIAAFFESWLAGDPTSDADCSGGTPDASDIDAFFTQWLAGGC